MPQLATTHSDRSSGGIISPGGLYLGIPDYRNGCHIYDIRSGILLQSLGGFSSDRADTNVGMEVRHIQFMHGGLLVCAGVENGQGVLEIWSLKQGVRLQRLLHEGRCYMGSKL